MIHFRSSSRMSPDPVCRAFSFPAHYHGFCPQQREVVWNLLLQDGSEGPPLIDYSVTQKSRLSPALLLMAHLKRQLQSKLNTLGSKICRPADQPLYDRL